MTSKGGDWYGTGWVSARASLPFVLGTIPAGATAHVTLTVCVDTLSVSGVIPNVGVLTTNERPPLTSGVTNAQSEFSTRRVAW